MKKLIFISVFAFILSGCSYQNELLFKHHNTQGISQFQKQNYSKADREFQQALPFTSRWYPVVETNQADVLYAKKKYKDVATKYESLIKDTCDFEKQELLPPACENILYGLGNSQYRLGESREKEEQKNLWESAIENYQKVLQINPKNTWAQENIAFIQKKLSEQEIDKEKDPSQNLAKEQQKNQQTPKNGSSPRDSSEENKENGKSKTKKDESGQASDTKNAKDSENKDSEQESKKDEADTVSKNALKKTSSSENSKNPSPSRLPKNIQKELENYQKKLDAIESQNQKFFQRNPNGQPPQNNDPFNDLFEDDPFFQDFFKDDPMMKQMFGNNQQKKFHKNLSNSNEKDW